MDDVAGDFWLSLRVGKKGRWLWSSPEHTEHDEIEAGSPLRLWISQPRMKNTNLLALTLSPHTVHRKVCDS